MDNKNSASETEKKVEMARQRFIRVQNEVYEATSDIPEKEIADIVAAAIAESRQTRNNTNHEDK